MKIKKAYDYLFYKLYKLFEQEQFHWMREWRVYGIILILEIFFLFSILLYYEILFNNDFNLERNLWFLIIVVIAIINFIYFHSKDQWKKMIKEFDKWSKKKNQKGTIIVYSIILFIIFNLIFSFYLYYQN